MVDDSLLSSTLVIPSLTDIAVTVDPFNEQIDISVGQVQEVTIELPGDISGITKFEITALKNQTEAAALSAGISANLSVDSAVLAESHANGAGVSADEAAVHELNASAFAAGAGVSEDNADLSAVAADISAQQANASKLAAGVSEVNAAGSAAAADEDQISAAASAVAANTSKILAAASAAAADASAIDAAASAAIFDPDNYEPANINIQAHVTSAHAPADANNYTHPVNHPPAIITQDASNRFVTDAEKNEWDSKAAGAHVHGDLYYTEAEVDALLAGFSPTSHAHAGVYEPANANIQAHVTSAHAPADANNYTHPANHPPSIITQDASNRFVSDAEKATWNGKVDEIISTVLAGSVNWDDLPTQYPFTGLCGILVDVATATNNPAAGKYCYPEQIFYTDVIGTHVTQIARPFRADVEQTYVRSRYATTWTPWSVLLNSGVSADLTAGFGVALPATVATASFAPNFQQSNAFNWQYTGNKTLANPTNKRAGCWKVFMPATTGTLGFGTDYKVVSGTYSASKATVLTLDSNGTTVFVYIAKEA